MSERLSPHSLRGPALALLLALLFTAVLGGCAAQQDHPLLASDPLRMSDQALLRYYDDLDAAIRECESRNDNAPVISLGGGAGSGGWSGVGVGISQPLGRACNSDALRKRFLETIAELRRRGVAY